MLMTSFGVLITFLSMATARRHSLSIRIVWMRQFIHLWNILMQHFEEELFNWSWFMGFWKKPETQNGEEKETNKWLNQSTSESKLCLNFLQRVNIFFLDFVNVIFISSWRISTKLIENTEICTWKWIESNAFFSFIKYWNRNWLGWLKRKIPIANRKTENWHEKRENKWKHVKTERRKTDLDYVVCHKITYTHQNWNAKYWSSTSDGRR